jgi:hypothetical protein
VSGYDRGMRLYPELPGRRAAVAVRDALVVTLLVLFALVGVAVHGAVESIAVLGTGVREAGSSVRGGFEAAADAVDGVPVVGDDLGGALRGAGEGTGGNVEDLGRSGEDAVRDLATLLGLTTFALPSLVLLALYVPQRVELARRLTAADHVLGAELTPERRRLVAMRAAFSLPYGQLLAYTRDPLGDLAEERYDALIAAALEDVGLRAPTS